MIDKNSLMSKFARIGARLKLSDGFDRRRVRSFGTVSFDVRKDSDGEYFEVVGDGTAGVDVDVLDVQPSDRHLLLMVREAEGKSKFLCGHDERHWFVAAVPESAPVGTVRSAKEALKPPEVREAQAKAGLGSVAGNRRKNAAYRRQGEWFFIPAPGLKVDERFVLRDEPISRGNGGKPHWCDHCFRGGGETVYVCRRFPSGLDVEKYRKLLNERPEAANWGWRTMVRGAEVYVRGRVRHLDHKTITLHGWHRVLMNTENQAKAMRNVAFLD